MARPVTLAPLFTVSALALLLGSSRGWATDFVVTNCSNDAELRAYVTAAQAVADGRVLFDCGTRSIPVTVPLVVEGVVAVDGGNRITIDGAGLTRIFVVSDQGLLVLDNIVLTGGSGVEGGAIYATGDVVLTNTRIFGSKATQSGGAIASAGKLLVLQSESVLAHNEADNGGAIASSGSDTLVSIDDSELFDNHATGDNPGVGGAIFLSSGNELRVNGSTLHDNSANYGGAITVNSSTAVVTVSLSLIQDNDALTGHGGGMYSDAPQLEIAAVTFSGNEAHAGDGGGLHLPFTAGATIDDSTFSRNTSADAGGGLNLLESSQVYVTNSTFSGNHAFIGAGIASFQSSAGLQNVTIAGNDGGGLYNTTGFGDVLLVGNTIVANSSEMPNCMDDGTETYISLDGNLSDDSSCVAFFNQANDQHNANDALGPLGMHGGLTATHVPQPGSDALDAAIDPGIELADQRFVDRPQGAAWDIGAVEVVPCGAVTCGDANRNSSLTASDALEALRTAVGTANCPDWLCDYDGNGSVAASDALAILRASVGQSTNPSCPDAWDCYS